MESIKLNLTLYVAAANAESLRLCDQLKASLAQYFDGEWHLDIVNVMSAPEKAVKNEVFTTPMLVRDFPPPVIMALGDIATEKCIIGVLTRVNHDISVVII